MNILEKFLELFKRCIILISGFEQLHLSKYAERLSQNLDFELVKFDYPNYDVLNQFVKNNSTKSLVIYGLSFEKDLITFRPSIHISLSGPRHIIKDDEKYNIYTENIKKSFINKFKNLKDLTFSDNTYDDIFDLVMVMIKKRVYADRYEEIEKEYIRLSSEESEKEESEKKKKEEKEKKKEEKKEEVKKEEVKKEEEKKEEVKKEEKKEDSTDDDTNSDDVDDSVDNITSSIKGGKNKKITGTRIIKYRIAKN